MTAGPSALLLTLPPDDVHGNVISELFAGIADADSPRLAVSETLPSGSR